MNEKLFAKYLEKLLKVTEDVETNILARAEKEDITKMKGTEFESVVHNALKKEGFQEESIVHSPQKFPDFIITDPQTGEKIGLEVKKTNEARWEIQGGSIFESLKNDIDDTYVLMGKFGGSKPEVRLKRYEECLQDLKVTHSPRFYLNMDLPEGEDYLTKKDARDLLTLSGDELNRKIRQLLRTSHSTWWSGEETIAFSDLAQEEKNNYLNDGIALFPEVLGSDYSSFTPWLVYNCLVWCGNVRDIFSAGGIVKVKTEDLYFSAVMNRTIENIGSIVSRIQAMSRDEIVKYWKIDKELHNDTERLEEWLGLVRKNLRISKELINKNDQIGAFDGVGKEAAEEYLKDVFIKILRDWIQESEFGERG